ncbi:hypothetical protein PQC07_gp142 [Aeromonas phage D3]|uniref:Uncharacterized protein n=1 Tax=Aeromonas phage D3 TaxID=2593327 RepID=A0A514TVS3_9CAUD|nr:hypothetical protein PQC07_gp142 [Aeromonas phage D3]QDJ97131.1 hypothetical protein D3_0133 [Aeromonas phage D3]
MIERKDLMLEAADEIIDRGLSAPANVKKFRAGPEWNLHLLNHKQSRSFVKMSKRRRKIFLATLTHFNPATGEIGTTRFGKKNGWEWIPVTHTCTDKHGKALDNLLQKWADLTCQDDPKRISTGMYNVPVAK